MVPLQAKHVAFDVLADSGEVAGADAASFEMGAPSAHDSHDVEHLLRRLVDDQAEVLASRNRVGERRLLSQLPAGEFLAAMRTVRWEDIVGWRAPVATVATRILGRQ